MKDKEKTAFGRYRQGYLDGNNGRAAQASKDSFYMSGYLDGTNDDLSDTPSKFVEDEEVDDENR